MNFDGDFIKVDNFDIANLKATVANFKDEWLESSWRQSNFTTHKNTQTIELIFNQDFRHYNPTKLDMYYRMESDLLPIFNGIDKYYKNKNRYKYFKEPGYIVRALLVKLVPGGIIPEHIDQHYSLAHSHRVHIPIKLRGEVMFRVGNTCKILSEGEVWEINNRKKHSVENKSRADRIHLILDWTIPGLRCCCGIKARPNGICSPEECSKTNIISKPCTCLNLK